MHPIRFGRKPFVAGSRALLAARRARAQAQVVLNIMDVAGALQVDRPGIDRFFKQFPQVVSRYKVQLAPSPELSGKLA